jgi:xanthine dehydrogenase accessory factor
MAPARHGTGMPPLALWLARNPVAAIIRVAEAKGSTPREAGAFMLVSHSTMHGTIGGGRLELDAIEAARRLLQTGEPSARVEVALGPEINQCCGGRVALEIERFTPLLARTLCEDETARLAARPDVLVFGAGHVGRALAQALAALPFNTSLVDTRPEALVPPIAGVASVASAMPETLIRHARPGSAVLVLTHDHALDFLLVAEALARDDLAFTGLIGSKTKKAVFRSDFLAAGGTPDTFARLVCPIGANPTGDKRPEIIAAFAAAELCAVLLAPRG